MIRFRSTGLALIAILVALLASHARGAVAEQLPFQLKADLAAALQREANDLWRQKNEAGLHYQRGSYSLRFNKIDDETYQGTFYKDVVSDDRMRNELYRMTLEGSGSKWEITERELLGTYEKLIRSVPGDETFHRFDSFEFEHEGMKISSGSGSLVVDYLLGEPSNLLVTGNGLYWEYDPPADLEGEQSLVWARLKEKHPAHFTFESEGIVIECDAAACKRFLENKFTGLQDASRDQLDKDLEDYYSRKLRQAKEARREHPFRGFRLPTEEDHHYYTASIKQRGKDEWISMSYDNRDAWEVNIWVSNYGPLIGYPSEATRRSGIDPYELEMRDDRNAQLFELVKVDGEVQVGLEDAELLRGNVEFTIRLKKNAQEIPFRLASLDNIGSSDRATGVTVNSLNGEDGQPLVYVKTGATRGFVVFPEVMSAGTEASFIMEYETTGSLYKLTPSYAYMERGAWLPFVRYTDKISEFNLKVTAPSKFKTIGVGSKVSEETSDDRTTTVWRGKGIHFPTIIFGNYFESTPKSRAQKLDGTEIPVTIHMDKDTSRHGSIPIKNLMPLAQQAINALNIYRELFGVDYPHGKLDLVNAPQGLSAQAPDSIVYVGNAAFYGDNASLFVDTLIAHEVAHQWWGGVIGNRNRRHYWFVESLAEYASAIFYEIVEGEGYTRPEKARKAYLKMVEGWRREILGTDLLNSVQNSEVGYLGEFRRSARRALIYAKGPYAFHILRETFGDEKFFAFLKRLAQELAGQSIVTRDIQRIAEESFGGTMEWFFDQWIRGVGIPEYAFDYDVRRSEDGGFVIQGTIKQRVVAGQERFLLDGVYYRGRVPIEVKVKTGEKFRKALIIEGPETPIGLKVPAKPIDVAFNKQGEILSWPVVTNGD